MKVLWGYPGWGWQMFGLIGKENKWFFGLSRKEFLPKETEQQRRNRLEEVLSIHKAFTDAAERKSQRRRHGVRWTAGLAVSATTEKGQGMCDYQGYEFGAGSYPDSVCIDGRLYDADNCDNDGNLYEPGEDIPCPMCNPKGAVEYWTEQYRNGGTRKAAATAARSLVADIRANRGVTT